MRARPFDAVVWTLKGGSDSAKANKLNLLTLAGLNGNVLFVHVGSSYLISQSTTAIPAHCASRSLTSSRRPITAFLCLFWVWWYWQKMLGLRQAFFLSKKFQRSIQSRSLMVRLPTRLLREPSFLTACSF